jgi:hypothetical protein
MLADDENGIDGDLLPAGTERLGNCRVDLESELRGALGAEVPFRFLIDVRGDDIERGMMPAAVEGIAVEEPLSHMPGVRMVSPLGGDDRHFLSRSLFGRLQCRNRARSTPHPSLLETRGVA